ncbi:MAG: GFA family protein [Brevundimonas sp.]|nr:GFA family protein [Brevundimonas sp.]
MLTGGCHCGSVRYEADGAPVERALCHCDLCRRTTGAPAVAWFTVRESDLRLTGEPVRHASSDHAERSFCGRCGTQITFRDAAYEDRIDVTTGSLDDPEACPPVEQIWVRSRPAWMATAHALPDDLERRPR